MTIIKKNNFQLKDKFYEGIDIIEWKNGKMQSLRAYLNEKTTKK